MRKCKLGEITSKIGSGATPRGGKNAYCDIGTPIIRSQNVKDFFFDVKGLAYISSEQAKKLDNVVVKKGDILFNITGDSIARCCIAPDDMDLARVNQHVSIIRCIEEKDNQYIMYYLQYMKDYLLSLCKVGGTRNALTKEALENIPIVIRSNHRKISDFLYAIDKKIVVNNATISTLDSMAKTIYDYWFVQFDFPDVNDRPYKTSGGKMVWNEELGREIPEGWDVSTVGKHVKVDRGISYSSEDIEGDGVPMVNLNSFNTDASYKVKGLKTYSGRYSKDKVINPYDLLICTTQQTAIDLTGQTNIIGKAMILPDCFNGNDIVASMDLVRLNCDATYGKYYLRLLLAKDYFHKYVTGYAIGTKIKHLHLEGLLNYLCEIPPSNLLHSFNKKMELIEKKKSEIINENQKLASLRDFLLPLLMNGQVGFK